MARSSVLRFPRDVPLEEFGADLNIRQQENAPASDAELARRVGAGEIAALEDLFERYREPLIHYAYRLLGDQSGAEDVVQETFFRIWTGGLDPRRGSIRSYLHSVARNLALDEMRRRVARSRREDAHGEMGQEPVSPARVLSQSDLGAAISAAIQALPERRREAFTLVYLRALSYAEAAEIMCVSQKTVGNHISGALATLRETLRPFMDEMDFGWE